MIRFLKRIFFTGAVLIGIFAASRLIVRALPGDPLQTLMAETGTSLSPEILQAELGLNESPWRSIPKELIRFSRGDFGTSILSKQPISIFIFPRILRSFELTLFALALGTLLSLAFALPAAAKPGGRVDRLSTTFSALAAALPTPWFGPMLIILFAVKLPIFSVDRSIFLPALTLAFGFSSFWIRYVRTRVRETLQLGFAQASRARGLAEWKIIVKYGLVPAAPSMLAYLGTQFGNLLAGAFVTEVIFNWKGLGSLLVEAVLKRDYPVVEAATFFAAASCLLGTFLGDLAQENLDPRREVL